MARPRKTKIAARKAGPPVARDSIADRREAAIAALQGLLASPNTSHFTYEDFARNAVRQADELLNELKRGPSYGDEEGTTYRQWQEEDAAEDEIDEPQPYYPRTLN